MSTHPARKPLSILVALAFCMALQMTGLAMILPLFARRFESFGAGVQALGASAMAYALASAVAAPLMGMLSDRTGRRPILLASLAGLALAFSGFLYASSSWPLILIRGLAGVFIAGLQLTMTSVVGDLAPKDRRAQWIGIVYGGTAVGYIVGPLLGGLLYDRFSYVVPFSASVVLVLGALLVAVFLVPETYTPGAPPTRTRSAWRRRLQGLPAPPTFFLLLLITFGVMFTYAFVEPEFNFYAYDDLDWTSAQLGLVMSAYGFSFMLGEFVLGQASDRVGRKPVLVLGLAFFSAQFAGLVVFHDVIWIVVTFALAGLGNALYDTALSALILDIAAPEHTASMVGLKGMAGSLGNLLGPTLVVLVTPFVAPQAVFLTAIALVLVLILTAAWGLRRPGPGDRHSVLANSGG
jgi:MFS family permease